jgi:hypothetical protein
MVCFKSLSLATVGSILLAFGTGGRAQAILLGSGTLDISTGVGGFDIPFNDKNEFEVTVGIGTIKDFGPSFGDLFSIFKGTIITPSDVGRTFTATQATDSEFNGFVSLLTNGISNFVDINYQELNGFAGGGVGTSENFFFINNPTQIDFFGNTIDSISLQINSFSITRSISENGFISSSFFAAATLSINGQPSTVSKPVPESSSALSILAFSALGVGVMRKRRCCKSMT